MDISVGIIELLRLVKNLIGHKIVQYLLANRETHEVDTIYGKVRGLQRRTVYDEVPYYAFEGIPFAKPPLGELRFRAPVPPEPWQGVRDCTYYRAKPLQRHFILHIVEGSEDCLYLNVYVKRFNSEKPLPVLVWIYGGGFTIGEASRDNYAPDYFMQQDVVFVAITYRLGALGFLSLKDPDINVPGNAGLKDQIKALRWIKANIANFNGNPNNITLFGESAGSVSTHIMMLTEQTRGLFHKAILQSGTALGEWAISPDRDWGYRLACCLGYTGTKNEKEILHFLIQAPARKIAGNDVFLITTEEKREYLYFPFAPVIEPYITDHCVVPKPLIEMLPQAWGNELPIILGGTSFEGLLLYQNISADPYFLSAFEAILPPTIHLNSTEEQIKEMIMKLKTVYLKDAQRTKMDLLECLKMISMKFFWHDIYRTILARLAYAPQMPTYLYRFDFDSKHFNHYRNLNCGHQVRGVSHADDISYLFYNILSSKLNKSSEEYKIIKCMIALWTTFAATSNPNCSEIETAVWEPVASVPENAMYKCLNISNKVEFIELPEREIFQLWNEFYAKKMPIFI